MQGLDAYRDMLRRGGLRAGQILKIYGLDNSHITFEVVGPDVLNPIYISDLVPRVTNKARRLLDGHDWDIVV